MLYATIMAGGAGTRFWPASRKSNPKQLLNLAGERSMIQATVDRLEGLVDKQHLLIVTNKSLVEPISQQLPEIPAASIIGEPAKRDTAPCVGLAAAWIAAQDPEATMVVMPADHVIQPDDVFQAALLQAAELVELDHAQIVTFGIKPSYPAESFGYIERGDVSDAQVRYPTFAVKRFREKPDTETARQFLAAGSFYWNSGIFVWKAKTILAALAEFEPEMFSHIEKIRQAVGSANFSEVLESEFCQIKGTSIDYAVMERYPQVSVIEAPFEWDDLGNWSAVPRLKGVDEHGNTIDAKHLGIDTRNTIVRAAQGHLVVTIGVKDCIIVQTPNATLVADKSNESAIKDIVKKIEENAWQDYL